MTPEENRLLREIARDEQWLREHAPPALGPDSIEHLRLRVRLEVDEAWLRRFPSPAPDPACVARIKEAVRRQIGRGDRVTPFTPAVARAARAGSFALAAAAVLVFGVFLGLFRVPGPGGATVSALDDLAAVMADAGGAADQEVAELDREVSALELALARSESAGADDDLIRDMEMETADLLGELESG